jgi:hypothetical protein
VEAVWAAAEQEGAVLAAEVTEAVALAVETQAEGERAVAPRVAG